LSVLFLLSEREEREIRGRRDRPRQVEKKIETRDEKEKLRECPGIVQNAELDGHFLVVRCLYYIVGLLLGVSHIENVLEIGLFTLWGMK
jgi:hypothetical protein